MARSQIQYGSQGSDVKELQKLLNRNGYSLDEDGIFGTKTQSAVKDYQKKMGLDVDGIVGVNTWSSFDKATSTNTTPTNAGTGFNYKDFSYGDYKESDIVTQAKNALDAQLAQKPGEYKSQWQSQLDDTINKILNREKFSYDLNGDALYQQYKDKYIQQGKMAMQDTMGQASAMTGGYGNSYAQSVGQQAYNAQLENLNDIVPELYQMAYDRYNQEGQDLYNQYSMLGAQEEQDYGRHRDTVSDWNTERDYLTGRYDSERNYDYSKYSDDRNFAYGTYSDDKSYAYNEHRNQIEDEQWQKNFEEAKRQYDKDLEERKRQFDENQKKNNVTSDSKETYLTDDETGNTVDPNSSSIKSFQASLSPESAHDAIARKMYGTYNSYVATKLADNKSLSEDEKLYLIQLYGITETDLNYARDKGHDI